MTDKTVKEESVLFLNDLKKLFNRGDTILKKALQKCFDENQCIEINGKEQPLVQKVSRSHKPVLALNNNPQTIDAFKDFCQKNGILLNRNPKRKGMLSAVDLFQTYSYPLAFFSKILLSCYNEKKTFNAYGKEEPLVEMCLSGSQQVLALNESKQALEIFKSVCKEQNNPLVLLKKQAGMLSAADLEKMYQRPAPFFAKLLEKCDKEQVCFTTTEKTKQPIVQKVKSGLVLIPVISNHPEALLHFIRYAAQNGVLLKKATKQQTTQPEFLKFIKEKILSQEK